jgi:uncharacterized protein (DUF1697 family)
MRQVLLLRGINLGPRRRIPMAELRALLAEAGFADVATHLGSGNIVLSAIDPVEATATRVSALIGERFGFEVPVVGRTGDELAAVLDRDPIEGAADDPRRYQVTFFAAPPAPAGLARLRELATEAERVAAHGRELYTWHPEGIARSKLAAALTGRELGTMATTRNWATVTRLRELASTAG